MSSAPATPHAAKSHALVFVCPITDVPIITHHSLVVCLERDEAPTPYYLMCPCCHAYHRFFADDARRSPAPDQGNDGVIVKLYP